MKRYTRDIDHCELHALVGSDAKLVLEIGCNDGTDTAVMRDCYKDATIVCFEPDPRAAREWMDAGLGDSKTHLFTMALSDEWGIVPFYQSGGSPYPAQPEYDWHRSGSLLEPTEHLRMSPWCRFTRGLKVPAAKLDDVLLTHNYLGPIDFIRIDVQGAELKVFRGGEQALKRTKWVLAECHTVPQYAGAPTELEMLAFMDERGFKCHARYANDLLMERT